MKSLALQRKIAPVIFQLPPRFNKDIGRLKKLLALLPRRRRYAFEFRDPSWHDKDIYDLLRRHKIAFCLFEKGELRSPRLSTADFNYVRLHGRKENYKGNYSASELKDWHRWLQAQKKDAYIFFDNTAQKIYALDNARAFQKLAAG